MYLQDKHLAPIKIAALIQKAVEKAFKKNAKKKSASTKIPDVQIQISEKSFGDYSSNIALILGKERGQNPREIASKIIECVPENDLIEKIEIAGPGFINIFIKPSWLIDELKKILKQNEDYGKSDIGKGQKVIVEYSQPNIAKPLGVHHLLSTIIGQSLYNCYKALGYDALSINYIGDWGTQFGKLIVAYKKWGDRSIVEKNPIDEFLKIYVRFHEEAEKNPTLEDEARKTFLKLEQGDEEILKLWRWCVEESMKEVQKTYDLLSGIHFDLIQGESFFRDKMEDILDEGKKKNIFIQGEGGSMIAEFQEEKYPPFLVQKSDGATLYSTRDFASLKYRIETFHPEKILYVVDSAQSLHFQQLFETAKRFEWGETQATHVAFGRMRFKDMNMSTRKGNILRLDEVLKEGIERAYAIVNEKNSDLSEKEKRIIAQKVGIGAVKYSILSQNRMTDIVFDWDKMLALEGNSSPYLQYTYARYRSILRKGKEDGIMVDIKALNDNDFLFGGQWKYESHLLRKMVQYPETINQAAANYKPNLLATYLYELTQVCNGFYTNCPVLQAENKSLKNFRLALIEATAIILKNGLNLLGIEALEKM